MGSIAQPSWPRVEELQYYQVRQLRVNFCFYPLNNPTFYFFNYYAFVVILNETLIKPEKTQQMDK